MCVRVCARVWKATHIMLRTRRVLMNLASQPPTNERRVDISKKDEKEKCSRKEEGRDVKTGELKCMCCNRVNSKWILWSSLYVAVINKKKCYELWNKKIKNSWKIKAKFRRIRKIQDWIKKSIHAPEEIKLEESQRHCCIYFNYFCFGIAFNHFGTNFEEGQIRCLYRILKKC